MSAPVAPAPPSAEARYMQARCSRLGHKHNGRADVIACAVAYLESLDP